LSSGNANPNKIDEELDQSLTKQYYAHRHGYKYIQRFSNEFVQYLGPKFLEVYLSSALHSWLS
jgi:hypothetical protein